MWGFADDLPRGAGVLLAGLLLLLGAGLSALAGRGQPSRYHPLTTVQGVVADVYTLRGGTVAVALDMLPGAPASGRVELQDPELSGAGARLRALPVGTHIVADYDAWTQRVWRLARADGGPGYGEAEVAQWRVADQAAGCRRAGWLVAAGLLTAVTGVVRIARGSDDPPPDPKAPAP